MVWDVRRLDCGLRICRNGRDFARFNRQICKGSARRRIRVVPKSGVSILRWTILRSAIRNPDWKGDAGSVLGDEPKVKGLMEGWKTGIDLVTRRQARECFLKECPVLGQGECFDGN